jgi:hypothetical protein
MLAVSAPEKSRISETIPELNERDVHDIGTPLCFPLSKLRRRKA